MPTDETLLLKAKRFRVVRVSSDTLPARDVIRHPGAVTIVPMVDDAHVCLIQNQRLSVNQTLIELPAGTLDPGEQPRETAERELTEETGYRAANIQPLHSFYLSPGILDERMHLFVATGLTAGETQHEPDERIENLVVPWSDALQMVHSGAIQDAKTIVGLLFYDRLRQQQGSPRK